MENRHFAILTFLALAFLSTSKPASAQEAQPGVARISLVNGEVSTQRGDSGDWVATTVNAPIVPGDRVSTGARSRTEVQLDYANILRLDQRTQAKIADLTHTRIQVQVAQGLVNFDVLKGSEAEAEIDTPNVAVRPLGEGRVRIAVDSDSTTHVTVREGEVEVSTPQGSTKVKKGEIITIEGTDNPQYQIASAPEKDDWDNWNKDRDHTMASAESWQHTNQYYAGAGDLDRYGQWEYVPGYDYVWAPYAGPGWVPYSAGRWVWEPNWGWTWVSYEPWGWAPYHYGRWFYWGNSWVWWPGPVYTAYRPLWAPAYVSFFGFGFGAGLGFGFGFGLGFGFGGSIGWLPIGPHDPFFPWYGRYGGSYNVVNVTNITNIRNIGPGGIAPLATAKQPMMSNLNSVVNNVHVRQALTTVSAAQFGKGQIAASHQAVTPEMLKQGQLVRGGLPVVPTRASLSPVNRPVNPAALPAHTSANQHFFTKTSPPAGPRPFAEQAAQVQRMIQQNPATLAAERGTGATGAPARSAQAQGGPGSSPQGGRATPEARTGSTAASSGEASNRSQSFGNQPAGQLSKAEGSSRTTVYDNEALNRLPESGFRRFGNQPAAAGSGAQSASKPTSQKPQGSASAPSGTPGSGATKPGWHRFGDKSSAPGERTQASPAPSRPSVQEQGGWQKFAPQRPAPSARNSESLGSRSESMNPSWNRAPSRSESPAYGQSPRSYQRPQLEIRKPIVTERATRSYDGGSRGSAPSGSRGSSSSGSHSGGHGGR